MELLPIEVARQTRMERLARVRQGTVGVWLVEGAKLIVHAIPVRRDQWYLNVDVGALPKDALVPLASHTGQLPTLDFDGAFNVQPGP